MSWIVGVDFSTKAIDFVYIDENDVEAPRWNRCHLEGADAWERTRELSRQPGWPSWMWDDVLAIGIEDPAGNHGTNYLYRVQGAILARIPRSILVQPWRPSQWRKAVGLPGNCSKAAVKEWVDSWVLMMETTGMGGPRLVNGFPQDVCDAFCIALATRLAITREKAA